jgi:hypothetical protein
MYEPRFNTCRFCHEYSNEDDLVRYGIRHYAHPKCLAGNVPYKFLEERGLFAYVKKRLAQDAARETDEAAE